MGRSEEGEGKGEGEGEGVGEGVGEGERERGREGQPAVPEPASVSAPLLAYFIYNFHILWNYLWN